MKKTKGGAKKEEEKENKKRENKKFMSNVNQKIRKYY